MKVNKLLALLACAALLFTGCSDDSGEEGGDSTYMPMHVLYVRFISPAGTNIVDSLGLINKLNDQITFLNTDDDDIQISCYSDWEGKNMPILRQHWIYLPMGFSWYDYVMNEETTLELMWVDGKLNKYEMPDQFEEIYTINLRSDKIFGDSDTHTIKWYVRVKNRLHDAYKCEVDGKEYSLENDPFYKRHWEKCLKYEWMGEPRHWLEAQVDFTINPK